MQRKSKKELIVHSNQARKLSLLLLPFFGWLAFDIFSYISDWSVLNALAGARYIKWVLTFALLIFLVRLTVIFCRLFWRYVTRAPAVVLNDEGLCLENFGLIPWENVEHLEKWISNPLNIPGEELVGLAISFKNPELVFNKGWLHQKIIYMLKTHNSLYHVLVQHLDRDPQEVAQFAKHFIQK
ncbi:MAG: hypothetical protein AB7F19_00770 [Candidatus Babeliales bacterium]